MRPRKRRPNSATFSSVDSRDDATSDAKGAGVVVRHAMPFASNRPMSRAFSARSAARLSDGSASYQHEVVSVEHVMPQQPAPNSQWSTWVPDAEAHQQWVHKLGNLTLLSRKKNSSASNYEFDKKKSAYFTKGGVSAFALTTQVLQHPTWTVDVMQNRQDAMLSKLEHHWRLEGRKSPADIAGALLAEIGQAGENVVFELESARHGLTALARESGTLFTVMAGSMAKASWSGQPHSYEQLRLDLQSNGSLKSSADGPWLVFTQDVAFKSPSAASATVLGRTDNGRNTWRMKGTSITYGAWQDNLPSGTPATGIVETDSSQP